MKGDISRSTFDRRSHYRSVRLQQGRVQLDADWNEQADLAIYRIETEAVDVIGGCGGPIDAAGFRVEVDVKNLSKAELDTSAAPRLKPRKVDFYITAGRYYVGGIPCENEQLTTFLRQPDLPAPLNAHRDGADDDGNYLVYLDAWERHVTAEEVPELRETALGGLDTATRARVVWQVKAFQLPSIPAPGEAHCLMKFPRPGESGAAGRIRLQAQAVPETTATGPCAIPPSAGYRGLGNQLFRVECHDPGAGFDATIPPATGSADLSVVAKFSFPPDPSNQLTLTSATGWKVGDAVRMTADGASELVAHIVAVDDAVLTLSRNITPPDTPATLHKLGATFKWCDENGSVATAIEGYEAPSRKLTVRSLGPDAVRGFAQKQLVEVTCPAWEVAGKPGFLTEIAGVNESRREVVLVAALPADLEQEERRILRRWQGLGAVTFSAAGDNWIGLRHGVQVQFDGGALLQGDYWLIPARTATAEARSGKIEWPMEEKVGGGPMKMPPTGVNHRYCPLAVVNLKAGTATLVSDCRHLFPPITQLTSLYFVAGDGQEAVPNPLDPNLLVPLPKPLVVGVANGQRPVDGAIVRFTIAQSGGPQVRGELAITTEVRNAPDSLEVETSASGLADCSWKLDPLIPTQQVVARLLDAAGKPLGLPVLFTATLSQASQVAYDPQNCKDLTAAQAITVQQAIDELCKRKSHGGCEVTVGVGGEFETVRDAIAALVDQTLTDKSDQLDICLCLRRGEHVISSSDLKPLQEVASQGMDVRLRMVGCGRGSRVVLAESDHKYAGWRAMHLERLTVLVASPCSLNGFNDVSIRDCYLFHSTVGQDAALLLIGNATRLRVSESTIEAWSDGVLNDAENVVFKGLPPAVLYDNRPVEQDMFQKMVDKFMRKDFSRLSPSDRTAIANEIRLRVPGAVDAFWNLCRRIADLIETDAPEPLASAFCQLRGMLLKRQSAFALAITGTAGDVQFENNDVSAGIGMYGTTSTHKPLTSKQIETLAKGFARVPLSGDSGVMQFRGNKLGRVALADEVLARLATRSNSQQEAVFRALFLQSNIFEATQNEFLGEFVVMEGNVFAPVTLEVDLGVALATRAAFASNVGPRPPGENEAGTAAVFRFGVSGRLPINVVNQVSLAVTTPTGQKTLEADNTGLEFIG